MNNRAQGFTLVELLMVVLIGAIVLGAVYQTLTVQERTNRHQIAIVTTEGNIRTAMAVLTNDLREASSSGGDMIAADSVSIRYRALRKAGVICEKDLLLGSWAYVAAYGEQFAAGDSILVFMDGANKSSSSDDGWQATIVGSVGSNGCAGHPIGNVRRIRTPPAFLVNADSGALIRSFVPLGFRIVDEGSGASLYRIEDGDSVAIVEGLSTEANQGLRFRYFKADGSQFVPNTPALLDSIMRIQIKVRAAAVGGVTGTGREYSDSLVGQVFLRGNRKTF